MVAGPKAEAESEAESENLSQTGASFETAPSDAAGAAKGLNDNAHGIDRFGYRVCPKSTLSKAPVMRPTPMCCF